MFDELFYSLSETDRASILDQIKGLALEQSTNKAAAKRAIKACKEEPAALYDLLDVFNKGRIAGRMELTRAFYIQLAGD